MSDGGRFTAALIAVEALWPAPDGGLSGGDGGWRGALMLNVVSMGAGQWQASWTLTHDAGSGVLGAQLRNAVAGVNGPLLASGQLATSSASPSTGMLTLTTAELNELSLGRAYVALPTAQLPEGLIRGQVARVPETVAAYRLVPVTGFPHPGTGGGASFLNLTTFTARYEAQWTSDVVATAAHLHRPDGGTLLTLALYPDAGGARGAFSVFLIQECQTQACFTDVHTADAGAPAGKLLRSY